MNPQKAKSAQSSLENSLSEYYLHYMPQSFIESYEKALASQDFDLMDSILHPKVSITSALGEIYLGRHAVRAAYERIFYQIKNENFTYGDIKWVFKSKSMAIYLFKFEWDADLNNEHVHRKGFGTAVLVNHKGNWVLLSKQFAKLED